MQARKLAVLAGLAGCAAIAHAQYVQTFDANNGMWQTWVSPGNEPGIAHVATGGVNNSGHVSVDLAGINFEGPLASPNEYIYWTAYLYADDLGVGRFDFSNAAVDVQTRGNGIDVQSGGVFFYINRYEVSTNEYSIFRTAEALTVNEGVWTNTSLDLSSMTWVSMVENGFTLSEVLSEATEFGFVVAGVGAMDDDPSGVLDLDEFSTDAVWIPAPGVVGLLAIAGVMGLRRRR